MKGLAVILVSLASSICRSDVVDDTAKGIDDNLVMPLIEHLDKNQAVDLVCGAA